MRDMLWSLYLSFIELCFVLLALWYMVKLAPGGTCSSEQFILGMISSENCNNLEERWGLVWSCRYEPKWYMGNAGFFSWGSHMGKHMYQLAFLPHSHTVPEICLLKFSQTFLPKQITEKLRGRKLKLWLPSLQVMLFIPEYPMRNTLGVPYLKGQQCHKTLWSKKKRFMVFSSPF